MRFVHTADWHLGKLLHGVHLTSDQEKTLLGPFLDLIRDARPDAVLVAGDVYDRAVPPGNAVALLDDVLSEIVLGLEVPVVLIAGNHDSAERLGFGARLLQGGGLHVVGQVSGTMRPVTLHDDHGAVEVWPLPYAEPPQVRYALEDDACTSHDASMQALTACLRAACNAQARQVLMAHAFVQGGAETESERPLAVGGAGTVDARHFGGFDYVALGHLHRPQAPTECVRYSGSLQKYSFSECDDEKGALIVELDADGRAEVETVALVAPRDLRRVSGLFEDLKEHPEAADQQAYLHVTLEDDGPVLNAAARLREVYPHLLHVERARLHRPERASRGAPRERLSDEDLFARFYEEVMDKEIAEAEQKLLHEAVAELRVER